MTNFIHSKVGKQTTVFNEEAEAQPAAKGASKPVSRCNTTTAIKIIMHPLKKLTYCKSKICKERWFSVGSRHITKHIKINMNRHMQPIKSSLDSCNTHNMRKDGGFSHFTFERQTRHPDRAEFWLAGRIQQWWVISTVREKEDMKKRDNLQKNPNECCIHFQVQKKKSYIQHASLRALKPNGKSRSLHHQQWSRVMRDDSLTLHTGKGKKIVQGKHRQ